MIVNVLLVHPDPERGLLLNKSLMSSGLNVVWIRSIDNNLIIDWHVFDVILFVSHGVDWVLLEALDTFEEKLTNRSVFVLTDMINDDHVPYRIRLYESGVDEIVDNDIDSRELSSKIKIKITRKQEVSVEKINATGLCLNYETLRAQHQGATLKLTPMEFKILSVLVKKANRVVTRSELGYSANRKLKNTLALDMHISNIRKKLPDGAIETVRSVGYMLISDAFIA